MNATGAFAAAVEAGKYAVGNGVSMLHERNLHGQALRLQVIQHTRDIIIEHLTASRENLRDSVQLEFQKFQTLMLMDTLMCSIAFVFVIEGQLPPDASVGMQYIFAITVSAAIMFVIVSTILLYEIQSRVSKWMKNILKDQLTRLRGIMLEGVHIDASLLNEFGIPYPKEFLERDEASGLSAVLEQRERDTFSRDTEDPEAEYERRRQEGQHILRAFHNRKEETEEEYIATVQNHMVQLRRILARAEPEQRFRNLLAGPLKPARQIALVFFHLGSSMLLLAALFFTLEYYRSQHGAQGPGIVFAIFCISALVITWAVSSFHRLTGGDFDRNQSLFDDGWSPEAFPSQPGRPARSRKSQKNGNIYGASGEVIAFPETTNQGDSVV
eukprot:gb/GECG01009796.1/.p1 GENE.gb/GECG01009796.1/~~gb/GECG01009796.1/.p1  ORF type:complete len:384 (+),score=38.75 gb/GECG01009796.1/:1-1152(+)